MKTGKIPVFGKQAGNSGLAANGNDLCIEDEIPDSVRLTNGFLKERYITRSRRNYMDTGRLQNASHRFTCFSRAVRWIE